MVTWFLRPIIAGIIIASLILLLFPSLRSNNGIVSYTSPPLMSSQSYNGAVQRAAPAVVNIYSSIANDTSSYVEATSLGSGVIMHTDGYIITNQHVINNARRIVVVLQNGTRYQASIIGSDQFTDLAVLKITADSLPIIPISLKNSPKIGDVVLAIGNPYNLGQTVTQGIISATGRVSLSPYRRQNFLQTDASINQGNSGGALINTLGELVGINTVSLNKISQQITPEGIGFAIPAELAIKIMNELIRYGRVIRGYIGIEPALYDVGGVLVYTVEENGPAAKAGIHSGDVLIKVNGSPIISVLEAMDLVAETVPGTPLTISLNRKGQLIDVTVVPIESPPP